MPYKIFTVLIMLATHNANLLAQDEIQISVQFQPPSSTVQTYARFEFSANNADTFQCQLNDEELSVCESPHVFTSLPQGWHQFTVNAYDHTGNVGDTLSIDWEVLSIFSTPTDDLLTTAVIPDFAEPNGWRGIFRINCDFAHSSYNDPVVYPGQLNRAHLHRFYGNTEADHMSTIESLISQGESSCQGNQLNLSAYWVPALLAPHYINGQRVIDEFGEPGWLPVQAVVGEAVDVHEIFYYSASIDDLDAIQPIPVGMKMIAGSHMSSPAMEQDTSIVRWHCQSWESNDHTNPNFSASIPQCTAPDRVRMDVFFPSCWNGTDLDSADHKSHMAYPIDSGGPAGVVCPESHPVPLVRPSYHYAFGVKPDVYDPVTRSSKGWRLASDMYTVDDENPGGHSLHADWVNAWHPEVMQAILDYCIKGELDCHDGNLANGFRLTNTRPGTQFEPAVINEGMGNGQAENAIDLWVDVSNGVNLLQNNDALTYTITVGNDSEHDLQNIVADLQFSDTLYNLSWSCITSTSSDCPEIASLNETMEFNLTAGESITVTIDAQLISNAETIIFLSAEVIKPTEMFDTEINNNISIDRDPMGIFFQGFEAE